MPLDFPNSPTNGQIFTSGIKKWQWSTAEGSWLAMNALGSNYLTSANFTGTNQSLATNGYQKLPGGLIIQWGIVSTTQSEGSKTVTFPISFPTNCLNVSVTTRAATPDSNGNLMYQLESISTTQFNTYLQAFATGGGTSVYSAVFIAIGY